MNAHPLVSINYTSYSKSVASQVGVFDIQHPVFVDKVGMRYGDAVANIGYE